MVKRARDAARALVDSALLTVLARAFTLLGIPVLLGWLAWTTNTLTDLQQRMAVVEASRQQARTEIIQRIERLEQSDTRDRETLAAMQQRLASLQATTDAILREIEAMRREALLNRPR